MEHWRVGLTIFGLLFGSGAVVGMLRYIIKHDQKHKEIDARLKAAAEDSKENKEDHERIEEKLDLQIVGLKELLVHFDLRRPGQGINGEE